MGFLQRNKCFEEIPGPVGDPSSGQDAPRMCVWEAMGNTPTKVGHSCERKGGKRALDGQCKG